MTEIQNIKKNQEEELSKKPYTFDSKGEIIFLKNVNVDQLSKEINYELRYNARKMPVSTKGAYAFEKANLRPDKKKKRDDQDSANEKDVKRSKISVE